MIWVFLSGLVAPFLAFSFLVVTHLGTFVVEDHLMHLILTSVIVAYSFYTGYYYYALYEKSPRAPLIFAGVSTLVFGLVFAMHGVVVFMHGATVSLDAIFEITEHYSLLLSALLFVGLALPFSEVRGQLYRLRKVFYLSVTAVVTALLVTTILSPVFAGFLNASLDAVSLLTIAILLTTALSLAYRQIRTGELIYIYFVLGLLFMASASYVAFFYTEWDVLWWYLHLLFPLGYTSIFVGLINWERDDLPFNLFVGELPFYRKIGTKLIGTIFVTGLLPLLAFGVLMFASVGGAVSGVVAESVSPASVSLWDTEAFILLMFRLVIMVALLAVLSAFFSFYFTSKLTTPLRRLRDAARRIARGEENVQIQLQTHDELEVLSRAFNTMSIQITERTKEIVEERARLFASIEGLLPLGFVIADINDNVLVKNEAVSQILGTDEDLTSIHDLASNLKGVASGFDVLTHSCRECVELRHVVELKEVLRGKKYLRIFCTPIIPKGENVIGYVILIEDITEAKVMERSRDEFFAVASHELRTPLTAIRGNAEMILDMYADKVVDNDMKEMLQDINASSVRLISVVNDFLEVSRLEQGRFEVKQTRFNVDELVGKVIRDLRTMIERKGLTITFTPPTQPLPAVFADQGRTEQVLVNLIGNSVKFTKQGGITVSAEVMSGFVGIRVTDTGIGISEQNQSLLFRKFQQAGEQMLARDVTQSTGLGLYISRLIMSAMGGTIGLEKSELGKGSTFMFTLPVATT